MFASCAPFGRVKEAVRSFFRRCRRFIAPTVGVTAARQRSERGTNQRMTDNFSLYTSDRHWQLAVRLPFWLEIELRIYLADETLCTATQEMRPRVPRNLTIGRGRRFAKARNFFCLLGFLRRE